MMDRTDRHQRYLLRLISTRALLYTEMITAQALCRGDGVRLLRHDPAEHPLALQLGGSDPALMAGAARLGADAGYDEININVGCPSSRVAAGSFGACLMARPQVVADCVAAMRARMALPVTVKTRIGIDRDDSTDRLYALVERVVQAGCRTFIVHARNAWLRGLSPKQNREVPPLRYAVVHALKRDFPELEIVINGGIRDLGQVQAQLARCDGVMLGREAYANPYLLAEVDRCLFGGAPAPTRAQVLERYLPYLARQRAQGVPVSAMTRHLSGLFQGRPGARAWRRRLASLAASPATAIEQLRHAAAAHRPGSDGASGAAVVP